MAKKDITKHKKGEIIYDAKIDGKEKEIIDYKIILIVIIFLIVLGLIIFG